MTLTVSILVPDGIVLGAESMATLSSNLNLICSKCKNNFFIEGLSCPKCKEEIKPNFPVSNSIYANKLFKIKDRNIGITTAGSGFVTGRTTESHIREFESIRLVERDTIEDIAKKLGEYFLEQAKNVLSPEKFKNFPTGINFIQFLVSGYNDVDISKGDVKIGKSFNVIVGKELKIESVHEKGYGTHIQGDSRVVLKLWKKDPEIPIADVPFNLLPLQDAIDYARFLIKTTIGYHRFAVMLPTCGGEIEIAVITPQNGFQWINKKELK